tara:strand:+ start:44 stop:748 length:705 start_codon:yes stop_codon:yes gene_type:complete
MSDTEIIRGKVKTVFSTSEPDKVLIQYEDKVTAGNGRKVDFPIGKGKVCMEISEFFFKKMESHGIRTHYIDTFPERIMSCKKVRIIPVEVVVRNVAAGSLCRQTYIEEGTFLNPPLVEFYLKDDLKDDPLLTTDRMERMGYTEILYSELHSSAIKINDILTDIFDKIDLTLVDFKLEYGYDSNGNLCLADELSPDSMRLWKKGTNESMDKDLFRKDKGDIVEAYTDILEKLKNE